MGGTRDYLQFEVRRINCAQCGKVKTETIPFLANTPFYIERFGQYVGERCRTSSIQAVAKELMLDWQTMKSLEMEYMQAQLERAGPPALRAIGVDEISIRKRHTSKIAKLKCKSLLLVSGGGKRRL